MKDAGFDEGFAGGITAASCIIGPLVPPSDSGGHAAAVHQVARKDKERYGQQCLAVYAIKHPLGISESWLYSAMFLWTALTIIEMLAQIINIVKNGTGHAGENQRGDYIDVGKAALPVADHGGCEIEDSSTLSRTARL